MVIPLLMAVVGTNGDGQERRIGWGMSWPKERSFGTVRWATNLGTKRELAVSSSGSGCDRMVQSSKWVRGGHY
jgi:hypothetical protein